MKICLKKGFLKQYLFDNNMSAKDFGNKTCISLPTIYCLCTSQYEPYPITRKKLKYYFIEQLGYNKDDVFEMVD